MRPPYRRPKLRKDTKGVSEIIGTMLILAMTVVLFSVIIIWVNSFPSPRQATRLDFEGALSFDVDPGPPAKAYANITIVHKGGDVLTYDDTNVYLRVTTGATIRTAKLLTQGVSQGVAYGLIDGSDKDWGTGERWNMKNFTVVPSDTVQVLITDNDKNLLLWDQILKPQVGDRPPLVITAYGDRTPSTQTIDVPMEREPFRFLAYVIDADGDLRTYSVYVVLAFSSSTAYRMYDDGTNGDSRALDGYYTSGTEFTPPSTSWDQGSVRVNATDNAGHQTFHWFRLDVQFNPVPEDDGGGGGTASGVPTNFICNGDQCYNIFRGGSAAGEWDRSWTEALPKRTFKESEQVVVAILTSRIKDPAKPQILNNFYMYDPFGTPPLHRVVYGSFSSRNVGSNCPPGSPPTNPPQTGRVSCTDSFRYNLTHTSGHYLYVYRFTLNPSGGPVNFASSPCRVSGCNPYQYYFTQYDVFLEIKGSSPQQDPPESKYFKAVDSITITDNSGNYRKFPDIVTYRDSGFTQVVDPDLGQYFNSTDKVYVAVVVKDVDAGCGTGAGCVNVIMGNVVIADYIGGQQVNRAPIAGNQANSPVCAYDGTTCSGATNIFRGMAGALQYQFSLSLSMANQDPWLEGLQNYALSVLSFRDSVPDSYSSPISTPIIIKAPIFKLDLVDASEPLQSNAWGTRDVAYYYENINGIDRWRQYPPLESGPD
ncbi:MAG TPA: type IV pilin N-terminal domain-containing protein, partial [Thermoplasmata archaeon]|nr:type IV pilin N-terminal domain-containing protein [Thermoplasmata archaeon]